MKKKVKKQYPFGYDPATAFGNLDLIDRLKKGRRKQIESGPCPECKGRCYIIINKQAAFCKTCKGKGAI